MLRAICVVTIALTLLSFTPQSQCSERPLDRLATSIYDRLQKRDFSGLEQLAERFRQNREVVSDGQPALAGFYRGVSYCIQTGCEDVPQSNAQWIAHGKLLDEWVISAPKSTTARLAKATYFKEYAWHARGTGYANTVTDFQWKLFHERIQQSRAMLEALKTEAQNDPQWYAALLTIAQVQSWPKKEFDEVFIAGTKRFPYYLPMYFTKATYWGPKWGGTEEGFKNFVSEVVRDGKGTFGVMMYTRLHWSEWNYQMFASGKTDWNRMREGFRRMTIDYPDPWNTNNFAKFACIAGDIDTLSEVMEKIGDSIIVRAWGDPTILVRCRAMTDRATSSSKVASGAIARQGAPEPVSPRPGAIINRFPRTTLIEWRPVAGAVTYSIEVDCYHCCAANKWCTDVGKPRISVSGLKETEHKFEWGGANLGRWRVWAVGADGKESPKSRWWEFLHAQ